MSTVLDWIKELIASIEFFKTEKLVDDIMEGKELQKEIEEDLKNADRLADK